MGDSRSWAADMENEKKTCQFGVVTKYFDTCNCSGCEAVRDRNRRVEKKAKDVYYKAYEVFKKIPEDEWDNVKSIKT